MSTTTDPADVNIPGIGTLTCSLGAAKRINAIHGGFGLTARQIALHDFAAYAAVVAAALEKTVEEVEAAVYAAGTEALNSPIAKYLGNLARGGKVEPKSPEGGKSGEN